MRLIRIIEPTEAGISETTTTWALTQEQYHVLLNYAINDLLLKGLITTSDLTPEQAKDLQKVADEDVAESFKQMGDSSEEDIEDVEEAQIVQTSRVIH